MRCEYGSSMRDARRRRVASRLRVLACIASCAVAPDSPSRPRKSATVARMNLGILSSYFLSLRGGEGAFSLPTLVRQQGPEKGLPGKHRHEERGAAGDHAPAGP